MIPKSITIQNKTLPDKPGIYLYRDKDKKVIYVGTATSLKRRVGSYWTGAKDAKTTELITHVRFINYVVCGSVLEALVQEANYIRRYQPKYNILSRDDKSFLYVVFPKIDFSYPVLIRGLDLAREPKNKYQAVFGPFIQPASLRAAIEILRRIFPFSYCSPNQKRACFDYHLGKCPGVCVALADKAAYRENIRSLIRFFKGESAAIIKDAKKKMQAAAKSGEYEAAAKYRDRAAALTRVRDAAILTRESPPREFVSAFGRVEGYDISNISGQYSVGSMVVFEDGIPKKSAYRIFNVKNVDGANDVASLAEVIARRIGHAEWQRPDIVLIDGGRPQLNAVMPIFAAAGWRLPVFGIAKGPDRKNNEIIPADPGDWELKRLVLSQKELFIRVRDEAHRFAISKYRRRHRKSFLS
jgi:excinuclease ABC subunit C